MDCDLSVDIGFTKEKIAFRQFLWKHLLNSPSIRDNVLAPKFFEKSKNEQYEIIELLRYKREPRTYCPGCAFRLMDVAIECPCGAQKKCEDKWIFSYQDASEIDRQMEENAEEIVRLRKLDEECMAALARIVERDRVLRSYSDGFDDSMERDVSIDSIVAETCSFEFAAAIKIHDCRVPTPHMYNDGGIRVMTSNINVIVGHDPSCDCSELRDENGFLLDGSLSVTQDICSWEPGVTLFTPFNYREVLDIIGFKQINISSTKVRFAVLDRAIVLDFDNPFDAFNKACLLLSYYVNKACVKDKYFIVPYNNLKFSFALLAIKYYDIIPSPGFQQGVFKRRKNPLYIPGIPDKILNKNVSFINNIVDLAFTVVVGFRDRDLIKSGVTLSVIYYLIYFAPMDVSKLQEIFATMQIHMDDIRSRLFVMASQKYYVDEYLLRWFKTHIGRTSRLAFTSNILQINTEPRDIMLQALCTSYQNGVKGVYMALYYSTDLLLCMGGRTSLTIKNLFYKNPNQVFDMGVRYVDAFRYTPDGILVKDTSLNGITLDPLDKEDVRPLVLVVTVSEEYWGSGRMNETLWDLLVRRSCSIGSRLIADYDSFAFGLNSSSIHHSHSNKNLNRSVLRNIRIFLGALREYDLLHWKFRKVLSSYNNTLGLVAN